MERNYTVYKHTSPSGKVYIGITGRKPEKRWDNGNGYKHNKHFNNAIKKYGWGNIQHEVLVEGLTKEQAEQMEIELIAKYRSTDCRFGYNISNGGNSIGKHSEKTKRKISKNHANFKGENHPMWGKKHSEEHRKKNSESHKGLQTRGNHPRARKVICEDMIFNCAKDCAEFYGVNYDTMKQWLNGSNPMPQEWFNKGLHYKDKQMSDYKVQNSEEHRRKISEARKGKFTGEKCYKSKSIICENKRFVSIKECAEYYGIPPSTMRAWLNGGNPTPQKFKDLGLRYATEEDIQNYPTYNKNIK